MSNKDGSILIGGTGRCGTSILGFMLSESPNLFPFFEPEGMHRLFVERFLKFPMPFMVFKHFYSSRISKSLQESVKWYLENNPPAAGSLSKDRVQAVMEQVFGDCKNREQYKEAFQKFTHSLLGDFSRSCGRRRWCLKQPEYLYANIDTIFELHPDMKFIHIVRDGRDVVSSMITQPWASRYSPDQRFSVAVEKWSSVLEEGWKREQRIPKNQLHTLRFEDLVVHPVKVIKALFEFIEEDSGLPADHFSIGKGKFFKGDMTKVGRYKNSLTTDQVNLIEHEWRHLLQRFDYLR